MKPKTKLSFNRSYKFGSKVRQLKSTNFRKIVRILRCLHGKKTERYTRCDFGKKIFPRWGYHYTKRTKIIWLSFLLHDSSWFTNTYLNIYDNPESCRQWKTPFGAVHDMTMSSVASLGLSKELINKQNTSIKSVWCIVNSIHVA